MVIIKEAAVGAIFSGMWMHMERKNDCQPFHTEYLWRSSLASNMHCWVQYFYLCGLLCLLASIMLLLKKSRLIPDCFMPSWCVACDCFPAFHSLTFALVYPYGVSYGCPAFRLHMLYHFTLGDLPKYVRENETKVVAFKPEVGRKAKNPGFPESKSWNRLEKSTSQFFGLMAGLQKSQSKNTTNICSYMTKSTFRLILSNSWLLEIKHWMHNLDCLE